VSRWDPRKDVFNTWFKDSFVLQQISTQSGMSMKEIIDEIDRRESFIEQIVESGVRNQGEVAEKILSYYNRQRDQRTNDKKKVKREEVPVPREEETADIIDMLKDASSSMFEDIVAQPSSEQEPESHEIDEGPEVTEPEAPEPELTEPEGPELGLTEPELPDLRHKEPEVPEPEFDDEPSTLNDLVKEQETELDFATKVLWELAQDASQLVIDKKMTEKASEVDAEEVQQT